MSLRTQLYNYHAANGKIVDFAGFQMPMWYSSIVQETFAVRNRVGIFDVSHMGRGEVRGENAEKFLNYVTTNDVNALKLGQAHYSLLCNETGGIKDDIIVLRLEPSRFVVVFNAGNKKKDIEWLNTQAGRANAEFEDISDETALISLQGPQARATLRRLSRTESSSVPRFGCAEAELDGISCLISGTGYTGEDGVEILVWNASNSSPDKAEAVWHSLLAKGSEFGVAPCGLGARDVLRLEAGMCLYGNDMDENVNPYEARLGFTVKLTKPDFIGKNALAKRKTEGTRTLRVGLKATTQGIPRAGCEIIKNSETIGRLTSGTFSPTLNYGIGMGYVPREHANEGQTLSIAVRGKRLDATVVKLPFYDTEKYGWQRKT